MFLSKKRILWFWTSRQAAHRNQVATIQIAFNQNLLVIATAQYHYYHSRPESLSIYVNPKVRSTVFSVCRASEFTTLFIEDEEKNESVNVYHCDRLTGTRRRHMYNVIMMYWPTDWAHLLVLATRNSATNETYDLKFNVCSYWQMLTFTFAFSAQCDYNSQTNRERQDEYKPETITPSKKNITET